MEAKEKAKYLADKFGKLAYEVVDEILKDELDVMPAKWMHDYWHEVRKEIFIYRTTLQMQ